MLVLYPLSLGPTAVIARRWENPTFLALAEIFYFPLLATAEMTDTEELFGAYAEWWCDLANTPPMPR